MNHENKNENKTIDCNFCNLVVPENYNYNDNCRIDNITILPGDISLSLFITQTQKIFIIVYNNCVYFYFTLENTEYDIKYLQYKPTIYFDKAKALLEKDRNNETITAEGLLQELLGDQYNHENSSIESISKEEEQIINKEQQKSVIMIEKMEKSPIIQEEQIEDKSLTLLKTSEVLENEHHDDKKEEPQNPNKTQPKLPDPNKTEQKLPDLNKTKPKLPDPNKTQPKTIHFGFIAVIAVVFIIIISLLYYYSNNDIDILMAKEINNNDQ
jgi:hypothetical protein